mmetsp:Transcript_8201/g.13941  ORF Transcript_8201/g.13941 Transcript_8201/m.13941 type:complete len:96 (+) Transcript_8201:562-849(+)
MDRPMFIVVVISLAVQSSIAYSCAACENDTKVHLLLCSKQHIMHTTISSRLRWRSELLALALMSTGENVILCDDVSKLLRISFPRRRYTQQRPIQ